MSDTALQTAFRKEVVDMHVIGPVEVDPLAIGLTAATVLDYDAEARPFRDVLLENLALVAHTLPRNHTQFELGVALGAAAVLACDRRHRPAEGG